MGKKGGGSATTGGVDFQQRISALALAYRLVGFKNFSTFGLSVDEELEEVRYETDDQVDDFVLVFLNKRVFVQAKRSISFSSDAKSIFSDVIRQFVEQYLYLVLPGDLYMLATSLIASKRITQELKKLTESSRLNENSYDVNPLSKSEKEIQNSVRKIISYHYEKITGKKISDEIYKDIFSRIIVTAFDIEAGGTGESSVVMLLSMKSKDVVAPWLWNSLITLCTSLSKNRQSISHEFLMQKMGVYIDEATQRKVNNDIENFLNFETRGRFSAGKEVLIIENGDAQKEFLIMELSRFDEAGNSLLTFYENEVEFRDGERLFVVHRAATAIGAQRFIEKNIDYFRNSIIKIISMSADAHPENNPFAKLYSEKYSSIIESIKNPLQCVHCYQPISENTIPLIEIDNFRISNVIGLTHNECLSPVDRVLGVIESELFDQKKLLRNFDYKLWYESSMLGVNIFRATGDLTGYIKRVLWNGSYNTIQNGKYCVKVNVDGGGARYVTERKVVQRYSETDAIVLAEKLNDSYRIAKKDKDPFCYAVESGGYGNYSGLLKLASPNEKIRRCLEAVVVPFSGSIDAGYSSGGNYYAPLVYLVKKSSGELIKICGNLFLISDPINMEKYIENWIFVGFEVSDFMVSIIGKDSDFDDLVRKSKREEFRILVDPLFQSEDTIISGAIIEDYNEMVKNS